MINSRTEIVFGKNMKMKNLLLFVVSFLMFGMTSCSVVIDDPSLELSSSRVICGEEITMTFNPGEDTNVNFTLVEFFWDNEKIGEVKNKPYRLKYSTDNVRSGFYIVSCKASYQKRKGTTKTRGVIEKFRNVQVQSDTD